MSFWGEKARKARGELGLPGARAPHAGDPTGRDVRGPGPWSWRRECCWRRPPRPGCWERPLSSSHGLCPARSPGGNGPGSPGAWRGPGGGKSLQFPPWEGLPPAPVLLGAPPGVTSHIPNPNGATRASPRWRHRPPGHRSCHRRCPGTQNVSQPQRALKTGGEQSPEQPKHPQEQRDTRAGDQGQFLHGKGGVRQGRGHGSRWPWQCWGTLGPHGLKGLFQPE